MLTVVIVRQSPTISVCSWSVKMCLVCSGPMTASREAEVGWWYVPSPANAPLDDCHGVWPWRGARYAQGDHDTQFAL